MMKSAHRIDRENRAWLAGYHARADNLHLIIAETDDDGQKACLRIAAEAGRRKRIEDKKRATA